MTDSPDIPELTNDVYARWLRAQRPPLYWFVGQPEMMQETMADLGDEHMRDLAIAIGVAVANPEAAADGAGLEAGSPDAEESILRRLADEVANGIVAARQKAPQASENGAQEPQSGPSLFGQPPTKRASD